MVFIRWYVVDFLSTKEARLGAVCFYFSTMKSTFNFKERVIHIALRKSVLYIAWKICQHWRRLNGQQIIHKICLKKINYFYSFGQKLCIGEEKIQMFHILHLNCFLHLHTELFVERTLMKSKNGHDQVSLFSKETGLYVYKQMWNIKVVYKKKQMDHHKVHEYKYNV